MSKSSEGVLAKIAQRMARQDVCSVILEVRGICLREKFESAVRVGDKVFCKLQANGHPGHDTPAEHDRPSFSSLVAQLPLAYHLAY